jgi:hypothetical protein
MSARGTVIAMATRPVFDQADYNKHAIDEDAEDCRLEEKRLQLQVWQGD